MGLETADYIEELDENWPLGGDNVSQGDDHLRLIKSVLKSQFPNLGTDTAVTKTAEELNASSGNPVGTLIIFAGVDTSPDGYIWCNGAALSRTTYADLWAAIGEQFGAGDGTTTFNLPDMRLKVPGGDGAGTLVGDTFGSDAWTEDNVPDHNHTLETAGAHAHSLKTSSYTNDSGTGRTVDRDQDSADTVDTEVDGWHSHGMISGTLGGASVDNRQSTMYFHYFIKY